jgi:protein TonB
MDFSKPDVDTPPASIHSAESHNGDSALRSLFTGTGNQVAVRPQSGNKPPIVSVLEGGVVTSRVQPLYPRIAIDNRVQGTVHLHAVITPRGTLEELQVLSGPPVLANAAADAVRQWKFRPYLLNGNAIAVQTEIIVKFSLN